MKKEEKQLIYNLLKTADAYAAGYVRDKFKAQPVFEDDVESQIEMSGSSPNMTESTSPSVTERTPLENTGALSLDELNAKILRCTRCGLARTRNNVVPGMGVEHHTKSCALLYETSGLRIPHVSNGCKSPCSGLPLNII